MANRLDEVLERSRVLVCVGQGGVGKTSTSAAIAMHAAYAGRRTLVLTIDPARRLAEALGLPGPSSHERAVAPEAFTAAGLVAPRGRMSAMMLDIKRAWDDVVLRYHPDPDRRVKLLSNRLYGALSTALAGSQEYMAMEKLYELSLRTNDPLDLIVLDTPPATNAMDFLDAPSKIIDALGNDATRAFLEPYAGRGRLAHKLLDAGSSFFVRTLSRFTGSELLHELAELLSCFSGMYEGFHQRALAVRMLLEADGTQFIIVATPTERSVEQTRAFRRHLVGRNVRVAALLLNRATIDPFPMGADTECTALERAVFEVGGSASMAERLRGAAIDAHEEARAEGAIVKRFQEERPDWTVVVAPELRRDIHDLGGIAELRSHFFS